MGLELRQQLKLSQQLVMTPQLQQAIKLLQLSRVELLETVQNELLENPCLEEGLDDAALDAQEAAQQAAKEKEQPKDDTPTTANSQEELMQSADWENYMGEFSSSSKHAAASEAFDEGLSFEARMSAKPSLEGHLLWQLRLSPLSERQMEIGEHIIANLSETGYLLVELEELAGYAQCAVDEVEQVLQLVQRLDPVGVASRTPQECLLVQLKVLKYDRDPILVSLVTEHLEDLENRRYKPLARKFKLSLEDIKEYLDIIQTLDPMPGASYGSGEPFYVSPDVYVYEYDDEFIIMLNDDGLPKLSLNNMYSEQLPTNAKDKEFVQDKMRSAVWLIKSLHQRQRTLYKVAESIVKYQREFFERGVTHLKPLILRDIAEDIEMHESTVSRITSNKYMATPHGIFELKFFFNSALGLDDGSSVGSESVKALIKQMIGDENPKKPLSDEKIGDMLKDTLQVNIARRTVAKYRTALNIPSSSKRKQLL